MGKRKNRKYNNDFKLRAVKLCLETDKAIRNSIMYSHLKNRLNGS